MSKPKKEGYKPTPQDQAITKALKALRDIRQISRARRKLPEVMLPVLEEELKKKKNEIMAYLKEV